MNNVINFHSRFNQEYFFSIPEDTKTIFIILGFYLLLLVSLFITSWKIAKTKHQPIKDFGKTYFWSNFVLIVFGLVLTFSRYELINIFSWRIWQIILLSTIFALNGYYFFIKKGRLEDLIIKIESKKRKEKWLPKKGKKK